MSSKKEQWTTIICPTCNHDVTTNAPETLLKRINSALARERKEAREAAFKEMISKVATLPTRGTMNYRRGYEEGVRDALRTIEAAADTEEGAENRNDSR